MIDSLAQDYPQHIESLYARGQIAFLYGQADIANWYWKQCVSQDPNYHPAHVQIGIAGVKAGNLEEVVKHLTIACRLQPESTEPGLHLGKALVDLGRPKEAIDVLTRQAKLEPRSTQVWFYLGRASFEADDFEQARKHYQTALDIYPECRPAVHGMMQVCETLGETEKASNLRDQIAVLDKLRDQSVRSGLNTYTPKETEGHILAMAVDCAATVYDTYGDAKRAEQHWRRAIELDAEHVKCRRRWLSCWRASTVPRSALEIVKQLRRIQPHNTEFLFHMASLHAQLNQPDRAEQCYRQVLEIDPQNPDAPVSLAQHLLAVGQKTDEARRLALAAIERRPTAENYFLLGTACRAGADRGGCRAALREALRLEPQNPKYLQALSVLEAE